MLSLRTFPDLDTLSRAVAESVAGRASDAVRKRGRFSLALAGGQTPCRLYERLAEAARLPWSQIHLFWGDERYVPHDDPRSNYRLVRKSLLDRVEVPAGNVHAIPTHLEDIDAAASSYETTLREFFSGLPCFDLVLLGMGADGHTASLFPGTPAVGERKRWVTPVRAPVEPPMRLTLTLPVILNASAIYFLISGNDKATTLQDVLKESADSEIHPAAAVLHSTAAEVVCWTDQASASLLSQKEPEW
jgi:6-phosphogluconolactonase